MDPFSAFADGRVTNKDLPSFLPPKNAKNTVIQDFITCESTRDGS